MEVQDNDVNSSAAVTAATAAAAAAAAAAAPHAWGEKRNWGEILTPLEHYGGDLTSGSHHTLASRLMNRGRHGTGAGGSSAGMGLHAKLMSPERKKKTPKETEQAMRERHERASSARRALVGPDGSFAIDSPMSSTAI